MNKQKENWPTHDELSYCLPGGQKQRDLGSESCDSFPTGRQSYEQLSFSQAVLFSVKNNNGT